MTRRMHTDEEIRSLGLKALLCDLGPDGLARFFKQFGIGTGDYTRDRHAWLPDGDVDDLIEEIKVARRRSAKRTSPA